MNIEVRSEWYNAEEVKTELHKFFVYGDNAKRLGMGGQAQIRRCSNARGVATKNSPTMDKSAFFSDQLEEVKVIIHDLNKLKEMHSSELYDNFTLVFPKDGLGTGLARLPTESPIINKLLALMLEKHFGVGTHDDGTLFKLY